METEIKYNVYGNESSPKITYKYVDGYWQKQYKIYDYLGSLRYTISQMNKVLNYKAYDPYGNELIDTLKQTRQGYIGKENDVENGLGDFGVRKYDGGRFNSPDPLWEKYLGWSPYQYCMNNPIWENDYDGRVVIAADQNARTAIINSVEKKYRDNIAFTKEGKVYLKTYYKEANLKDDLSNFSNYGALQALVYTEKEIFTVSTGKQIEINITATNTVEPVDLDFYNSSAAFLPRKSSGEAQTSSGGNEVTLNTTIYQNHLTHSEGTYNNSGRAVAHELFGHGLLWYWKIYKGWRDGYSHDGNSGAIIKRQKKMWINKLEIAILLLTFLLFSCNRNPIILNDSKLLAGLEYKINIQDQDSSIIVDLNILNNSKTNIFIPITDWLFDGKSDVNHPSISQPVNPGITNTIHFYPKGSNVFDAVLDIGWRAEKSFYPSFIEIESKNKKNIELNIPKYLIQKDNIRKPRFINQMDYVFLLKLSIISQENIERLIAKDFDINKLVIQNPKIDFIGNLPSKPRITYKESTFPLNMKKSEFLNKMCENKLDIYFEYKPKY